MSTWMSQQSRSLFPYSIGFSNFRNTEMYFIKSGDLIWSVTAIHKVGITCTKWPVAVVEAFAKSTMWVGMKFERRDSITKRKVRVYHSFSGGGLLIVDLGKVRRCEPCGICSGGGIVETSLHNKNRESAGSMWSWERSVRHSSGFFLQKTFLELSVIDDPRIK